MAEIFPELVQNSNEFAFDIANGGTESAVLDLSGGTLCGLYIPAAFTGSTVTFQASPVENGGLADTPVWYDVRDEFNALVTATITAGDVVALPYAYFLSLRFVRLVVSAQAAARTVPAAVRPFR